MPLPGGEDRLAEGGDRQSERVPYSIERALLVRRGGCAGFGRCSFVAARNSEVDVVQSVGRVMRTFHKGLRMRRNMVISLSR